MPIGEVFIKAHELNWLESEEGKKWNVHPE